MKIEKKYVITESQLKTVIKDVIKEQGLYGNTSDVVDYDLPEYLSDVIILRDLESMNDVENSVKELHKRVMRLEKGLDTAGSHQKAYGTDLLRTQVFGPETPVVFGPDAALWTSTSNPLDLSWGPLDDV